MSRNERGEELAAEFGRRVRRLRESSSHPVTGNPLSQEGLALLAGWPRAYQGRIERGEANVTLRSVVRVAAALRVDPGDLVRGLRP